MTVDGTAERGRVAERIRPEVAVLVGRRIRSLRSEAGLSVTALVGLLPDPSPDGIEVWSTPNGSWAYLLKATGTPQVSVELWKWRIAGDDGHRAAPAAGAPDSMAHVLRGRLRVRSASCGW
ncbi:hypothetical protein KGD83_17175 [Nocardiopsis akebiae]|uniref:XRE family transcriptional regulator n=1 Tax=Nocardiopsis akebiae TaxID=2831968 RepID=A0ABX8BY16_9ACTN|nr:hypothetical protein [Nocardiopsis akebiae]QUX27075.1 hypothetical protein KGD83_17175 [Nocardiopsis akebiae]